MPSESLGFVQIGRGRFAWCIRSSQFQACAHDLLAHWFAVTFELGPIRVENSLIKLYQEQLSSRLGVEDLCARFFADHDYLASTGKMKPFRRPALAIRSPAKAASSSFSNALRVAVCIDCRNAISFAMRCLILAASPFDSA